MTKLVAGLLVLLSIWGAGLLLLDRRRLEARADTRPRFTITRISEDPDLIRVIDDEWGVAVYVYGDAGGPRGLAAVKVPSKVN